MESPSVPTAETPIIVSPRVLKELEDYNAERGQVGEGPLTREDIVSKIVNQFRMRQAFYSQRNASLFDRRLWFEGEHWAHSGAAEEDQGRLVFNFVRNVVLRFTAILARTPRPRVPRPTDPVTNEDLSASHREKFLLALWPDVMKIWRQVELNASKLGYGVLECLWDPPTAVSVSVGVGVNKRDEPRYTESPFRFRCITSENFYPVYKSFDRPDDFLYAFIHDPDRLVSDLELKYGVTLQTAGIGSQFGDQTNASPLGTDPTAECIKYWDGKMYAFVAVTKVLEVVVDPRASENGGNRGPRAGEYETIEKETYALLDFKPHKLPRIPVWVLRNIENPDYDPTWGGSISDTEDIIGLNQHYNWIVSEEADEIVTHIHRPVVYHTDSPQQDPNKMEFKPGKVITIGRKEDEQLDMLEWKPEPGFVDAHLSRIQEDLKDLSFLSSAGFGRIPSGTSGVAAMIALNPLQQATELKVPMRQEALQGICKFLLQTFEAYAGDAKFQGFVSGEFAGRFGAVTFGPDDVKGAYYAEVDYGNLLPRDDNAFEQNEMYKYKTGGQALWTTLDHLGVDDPDAEIARIKKEQNDPELNPDKVLQIVAAKQALQAQQQPPAPAPNPNASTNPQDQGGASSAGIPLRRTMPGTTQPGTRPVQAGPSMNEAPPVPGNAAFPGVPGSATAGAGTGAGPAAPFMRRVSSPNPSQVGAGAGQAPGGNPFLTGLR